jgi:hypothetical protein
VLPAGRPVVVSVVEQVELIASRWRIETLERPDVPGGAFGGASRPMSTFPTPRLSLWAQLDLNQ